MIKKLIFYIQALFSSILFFTACNNDNNPDSPYVKGPDNTAILIYAVASNNLEDNLYYDKIEMIQSAREIDLVNNSIYLYEIDYDYSPKLQKLVASEEDKFIFESLKEYPNSISSLSPSRIAEVISDFKELVPAEKYGIFFWSHGTGADPYYNNPSTKSTSSIIDYSVMAYSFGYDKTPGDNTHSEINIDDLADALEDGSFNFIWFDACYMAGIETIYQLRNKADYFVGYATEVYSYGIPYEKVLPLLAKETPDLKGAAEIFFDYYENNPDSRLRAATIAIADLSKIEAVASFCKETYNKDFKPSTFGLQKYTRLSIGPFYDFGQYSSLMLQNSDSSYRIEEFNRLMDNFIIYKAATKNDFNYNEINKENFSGISTHIYDSKSFSEEEEFFRSLDWYEAIFN